MRKAVEEEKQERERITLLEKEILQLEGQLAAKMHSLSGAK